MTSSALLSSVGSSSIASNPVPEEVIQPNGVGALNFTVDVPANAPLGSTPQTVNLSFLDQWSQELSTSQSFNVNIDGRGYPTLTTVLNNVTLGSSSLVSFQLNNNGTGGMYSTSIAIQVAPPLILVSNSVTSSSEEIPPAGGLPVKAVISTGPTTGPGNYPGTITVTYLDEFQVSHTLVFSVEFTVVGSIQTSISITTLSSTVTVGTVSDVSFDVNNIGNASMLDPTFTLQVPTPLVIAANSSLSSTLPILPGDSMEFDVSLTAGPTATDGAYPGAIVVTYTDAAGGLHNQTVPVGFTVVGTVQTYVQVGTLQNEVNIGSESTVSFAISNVGTENMSSPTFTLSVSTPLVVVANSTFSSTTMIPPGGDVVFSATITCGPSTVGGDYPGTITVTYVDKIGTTHSLTFAVGFLVSGSTRTSVAVSTLNNTIAIGSTSTVSFLVSNVGSQPMQAPGFSLQVTSPLVITSNSSLSMTSPILPGSSAVFESNVTAG
ncbi:MAG: COG1361 S-layer family protein, partial [Nitrososphaerales archaeon]